MTNSPGFLIIFSIPPVRSSPRGGVRCKLLASFRGGSCGADEGIPFPEEYPDERDCGGFISGVGAGDLGFQAGKPINRPAKPDKNLVCFRFIPIFAPEAGGIGARVRSCIRSGGNRGRPSASEKLVRNASVESMYGKQVRRNKCGRKAQAGERRLRNRAVAGPTVFRTVFPMFVPERIAGMRRRCAGLRTAEGNTTN